MIVKTKFDVSGMTCAACQVAVKRAVTKMDGVSDVNVNLMTNSMVVDYNEDRVNTDDIIKNVVKAGYNANTKEKTQNKNKEKFDIWESQLKDMGYRLKVSIPFTIILMYVAMGHMINLPLPSIFHITQGGIIFALTQFLLTLPVIFVNRSYYIRGFKSLFNLSPNMDSLIAIGSGAALVYGVAALYIMAYALAVGNNLLVDKYRMNLYFESASTILTLVTVGKYLETRSKRKTSNAITSLMNLQPKQAKVVIDDKIVLKDVDKLEVGDIIEVKPGEIVAVDGVIVSGVTSIDESPITGESIPVEKKAGDKITGATINKTGNIRFKALQVGENTTLSKIIQLVEDANNTKAPIESLADKISGYFVPFVIVVAMITFVIWIVLGEGFSFALELAVSVLVISCPCALGLATPVAIMVSTGKGAENGILFKNSESLELMHSLDKVVFDKTGTLTQGYPVVTDIVIDEKIDEKFFLTMAYSIEKKSEQPLAEAIVRYCENYSKSVEVEFFEAISGRGVKGTHKDKYIIAGNKKLMEEEGVDTKKFDGYVEKLQKQAKTPMYFVYDGKCMGIIAVTDRLKNTSKEAVDKLHSMGISTVMLTGDNNITAKAISDSLGIDEVYSDVLPQEKDQIITKIKSDGDKVAMVGDGINDAIALVRADVGIAIGAGTDVAIDSADVVLMKSDIQDVGVAIDLSKKTMRTIKQNLFWAFFYNIIFIPVAAGVFYKPLDILLNPMMASVAMSFSSLFVVSNALRLRKFKPVLKNVYKKAHLKDVEKISPIFVKNDLDNDITKEEKKNMKKEILVEGMMCEHCVAHVKKALETIDTVKADVSLEDNKATIISEKDLDDKEIYDAMEEAGYTVKNISNL